MDNTQRIRKLQSEILAIQSLNNGVAALIETMNKETEVVTEDTEKELIKLREQIRKDIAELKSFSNPNIYGTRNFSIRDKDDKYGLKEGNEYPVVYIAFCFGGGKKYGFLKKDGTSEVKDVAITEDCHTYCPIFRDGTFADELSSDKHDVRQKEINAFYRHWPAILVLAYEEILEAYKDKATKDLKDAYDKKSKALRRQMDIKAALLASVETE